jgi:hypothetical protein
VSELSFEATVIRIARMAARQGGSLSAGDVEHDDVLARNPSVTSAAAHMLAGGVNVVSRPPDAECKWFPYAELTFTRMRDADGDAGG